MDPFTPADVAATAVQLPFRDCSIAEVLCEHTLEHLDFAEAATALSEFGRILRSGGSLVLEVPDMEKSCLRFLNTPDAERWTLAEGGVIQTIYGHQAHAGEYHKSGYSFGYLFSILATIGFANIRRVPDTGPWAGLNLRVLCEKP